MLFRVSVCRQIAEVLKRTMSENTLDSTMGPSDWPSKEVPLPKHFHRHIFGKGGVVKKRLECLTDTQISLPKAVKGQRRKDVINVKYRNESSLHAFNKELESTILNAKKRMSPTHFISIPVASPGITENLRKFQVLCGEKIHPHKIQYPSKLHLTIGVLKLFSDEEVQQACNTLLEFSAKIPPILSEKPLHGTLKNLRVMRGDDQFAKVVYSEFILSDDSDRLQNLADKCLGFFVERGLMEYQYNTTTVKLHCTLINTRWNNAGPRTINASDILSDKFELQVFGNCVLDRIDLNEMKADISFVEENDKRYLNVTCVSFK